MKFPKAVFNKLAAPLILTSALLASPVMATDGSYTVKACTPEGKTVRVEMMVGESHGNRNNVQNALDAAFADAALKIKGAGDTAPLRAAPVALDKIDSFRADMERQEGAEAFKDLRGNADAATAALDQAAKNLSVTVFDAQLYPMTSGCAPK